MGKYKQNPKKQALRARRVKAFPLQFYDKFVKDLADGKIDPQSIYTEDRRECGVYLRARGWTVVGISKLFGVSRQTIYDDFARMYDRLGRGIADGSVYAIGGHLISLGESVIERALKTKDFSPKDAKLIVETLRDINNQLMDLGLLARAPQEVNLNLQTKPLSELTEEELRAERERIRQRRAEIECRRAERTGLLRRPGTGDSERAGEEVR